MIKSSIQKNYWKKWSVCVLYVTFKITLKNIL